MTAVTRPALRVKDFAPHLAGRMLPGMFDYLGIGKVERFPGDPYAHQQPWAAWFWMHTTECGSPNHVGSSKAWTIPCALRETWPDQPAAVTAKPAPRRARAAQAELFAGHTA